MSLLTDLLKAKDSYLTLAIKQLEELTGKPGVDTALIGEILGRAHGRAGKLGLDPDFNGRELYHSLMNRVKADNERLAQALGGSDPDDAQELIPKMVKRAENVDIHRTGWFLKEKVARRMLRETPPQNVMKLLGYTNVDKLLKDEDLYEIYGSLRFAETADWMNSQFLPAYKKLTFNDFERRQIKIISFDSDKWGDIAHDFIKKKLHNITHLKEMGVVMTMPLGKVRKIKGVSLVVLPLLIHYLYEVRLYSAFFKLISVKQDFGKLLVDTLVADAPEVSVLSGTRHKVHWRVIQRYFGKLKDEYHPEIFEPHVQPEDLHWRKAEEVLYQIDPELKFWEDMDYVGLNLNGDIVTFNLLDVSFTYSHNNKYEDRYLYHFRGALWNEIFMRYMGQDVLEGQILKQLDNELIAPEKVKGSK